MLIRSLNGEVAIPFGAQHEVVYQFTGDPALAEVNDEAHARLLLASPHLYQVWEGPRPKPKPTEKKRNRPRSPRARSSI